MCLLKLEPSYLLTKTEKCGIIDYIMMKREEKGYTKINNNMKLVVLVDSPQQLVAEMVEEIEDHTSFYINTERCSQSQEYTYLMHNISDFAKSGDEIMLAKFSGREDVAQEIGDNSSEMVVPISDKKDSKYYTEGIVKTFIELVQTFEKGD